MPPKKVTKAPAKPKKLFIVCWDDDGDDPWKEFPSKDAAEKHVKHLVNFNEISPEDIKVYEAIKAYKCSIELI